MRIPMETWSDYVRRVAGTLTHAQIAQKSGVASSNVGRWLRGEPGLPRAETVIAFACDQGCFGARSSIYEMLLRFGYGAAIGPRTRKNNNPGNSTEKKNDVLLHTSPLVFIKDRLASNLKRYTNGQIKPKQNPLLVLANMAQQSSTSV
jgi:transcriptional regulator with XRE-family HTH domain